MVLRQSRRSHGLILAALNCFKGDLTGRSGAAQSVTTHGTLSALAVCIINDLPAEAMPERVHYHRGLGWKIER